MGLHLEPHYHFDLTSLRAEIEPVQLEENLAAIYRQTHKKLTSPIATLLKQESEIEDVKINLVRRERRIQQNKDNEPNKDNTSSTPVKSLSDILTQYYDPGLIISPNELMKLVAPETRSLLIGPVGIGKSSAIQYITYMWAKGLWREQYEILIKIKLRNLNAKYYKELAKELARNEESISIEHICRRELFSDCKVIVKDESRNDKSIERNIKSDEIYQALEKIPQNRRLIILDGLEELSPKSECKPCIDELIEKSESAIIITCHHASELLQLPSAQVYDCVGYTSNDIYTLLCGSKSTFNSTEQEEILTYFFRNPAIANLARIPLIFDILRYLWSKKLSTMKDLTLTQLFELLLAELWLYYDKNMKIARSELSEETLDARKRSAKKFLYALAFRGLKKNLLVFDYDFIVETIQDVFSCDIDDVPKYVEQVILFEFLKQTNNQQYEFLHKLLQIIFAAKHIESTYLLCEDKLQTLIPFKYNPLFDEVWHFAAGLLVGDTHEKENKRQILFKFLMSPPRDIFIKSECGLLMRCMEECQFNTSVSIKNSALKQACSVIEEMAEGEFLSGFNETELAFIRNLNHCPRLLTNPDVLALIMKYLNLEEQKSGRIVRLLENLSVLPEPIIQEITKKIDQYSYPERILYLVCFSGQDYLHPMILARVYGFLKSENHEEQIIALKLICKQIRLPQKMITLLEEDYNQQQGKARLYLGLAICSFHSSSIDSSQLEQFILTTIFKKDEFSDDEQSLLFEIVCQLYQFFPTLPNFLIEKLKSNEKNTRALAIEGIKRIKVFSQILITDLISCWEKSSIEIKEALAELLSKLVLPQNFINELVSNWGNYNRTEHVAVLKILRKQTTLPLSFLLILLEIVKKETFISLAFHAKTVLKKQSSLPNEIIAELLKILSNDHDARIWSSATIILAEYYELYEDMVRILGSKLGSTNMKIAWEAFLALEYLDSQRPELGKLKDKLLQFLQSPKEQTFFFSEKLVCLLLLRTNTHSEFFSLIRSATELKLRSIMIKEFLNYYHSQNVTMCVMDSEFWIYKSGHMPEKISITPEEKTLIESETTSIMTEEKAEAKKAICTIL